MLGNQWAVMIPTTVGRDKALEWNVRHLLQHLPDPFSFYIYNDLSSPIRDRVATLIKGTGRGDISLVVLNDKQEIHTDRVGCGGARHYLFEAAKQGGHGAVASLDDDMQITANWYHGLKEAMQRFPKHSVFATAIRDGHEQGNLYSVGSSITIEDIWLRRSTIKAVTERYQIAPWAPMGNLLLCREALRTDVVFPRELFVSEDVAMFLRLRELGINETIIATDAVAVHKGIETPRVVDFRTYHTLRSAARYIWHRFGVNVMKNFRLKGFPTDEEGMRAFVQ